MFGPKGPAWAPGQWQSFELAKKASEFVKDFHDILSKQGQRWFAKLIS